VTLKAKMKRKSRRLLSETKPGKVSTLAPDASGAVRKLLAVTAVTKAVPKKSIFRNEMSFNSDEKELK